MPAPRPFALIGSADQWLRCGHTDTALVGGAIQLAWVDETPTYPKDDSPLHLRSLAGLAFDSHCRLFHSLPAQGRVERVFWAASDPLQPAPTPVVVENEDACQQPAPEACGDFTSRPGRSA